MLKIQLGLIKFLVTLLKIDADTIDEHLININNEHWKN